MSDVEIRRNEIIELLYTYKKYSIDDFAKRFGVSRRTINYDIEIGRASCRERV